MLLYYLYSFYPLSKRGRCGKATNLQKRLQKDVNSGLINVLREWVQLRPSICSSCTFLRETAPNQRACAKVFKIRSLWMWENLVKLVCHAHVEFYWTVKWLLIGLNVLQLSLQSQLLLLKTDFLIVFRLQNILRLNEDRWCLVFTLANRVHTLHLSPPFQPPSQWLWRGRRSLYAVCRARISLWNISPVGTAHRRSRRFSRRSRKSVLRKKKKGEERHEYR